MFLALALLTIAPAASPSTGSSTRTFAPPAIAASACCCWSAATWLALAYLISTPGHSCLNFASKNGRSAASERVVCDSGRSSALLPPLPPPPSLFFVQPAAASVATSAVENKTADTTELDSLIGCLQRHHGRGSRYCDRMAVAARDQQPHAAIAGSPPEIRCQIQQARKCINRDRSARAAPGARPRRDPARGR